MLLTLARPGLLALRAYWKPFLLIQSCGLALVIGYFQSDAVRAAADAIADLKTTGGLAFVVLASALSGAVAPELAKAVALGQTRVDARRLRDLLFHLALFAILGLIGNAFFNFIGRLWPNDGRAITVAKKVLVDQSMYTTLIIMPVVAFAYTWRQSEWSLTRCLKQVGPGWYLLRVVPLLIPCWCFWIPITTLMYTLPASLVFCFAMCAQAAWCLLMTFVAASGSVRPTPEAATVA